MLRRFSKIVGEPVHRNHLTQKPQGNQTPIETERTATAADE